MCPPDQGTLALFGENLLSKFYLNQTQCKFVLSTFVINADMCYLLSAELSIPNLEPLSFLSCYLDTPLCELSCAFENTDIVIKIEFILFFMVVI